MFNYILQASTYSKLKILKCLQGSFIKFFFKNAHQVSYTLNNKQKSIHESRLKPRHY